MTTMTHEEEAKAALPGCKAYGYRTWRHDVRAVVLIPLIEGWWANYDTGSNEVVSAHGSTAAAALTALRAKLTEDDLRRAFPDQINTVEMLGQLLDEAGLRPRIAQYIPDTVAEKARALQAFFETVRPDEFGDRRVDIDDDGCPCVYDKREQRRSSVIVRGNTREHWFECVDESPTTTAVIEEWIRQGSEQPSINPPITEQGTMNEAIKSKASDISRLLGNLNNRGPNTIALTADGTPTSLFGLREAPVAWVWVADDGTHVRWVSSHNEWINPVVRNIRSALKGPAADVLCAWLTSLEPPAPTVVPPELATWQPGEWRWDDRDTRWTNGYACSWETTSGVAVGCGCLVTQYGATYAEAIAKLRSGAQAAMGNDPVHPPAPRATYTLTKPLTHTATLYVDGKPLARATDPEGYDQALAMLSTSPAWRACEALGFEPHEEPS